MTISVSAICPSREEEGSLEEQAKRLVFMLNPRLIRRMKWMEIKRDTKQREIQDPHPHV